MPTSKLASKKKKMESRPSVAKLLKYFFGLILFCYSFVFSKDVIHKYQEKVSTFKSKSETATEVPTTVFCFEPSTKISMLNKLNLTDYSLVISISEQNLTYLNSIGMSRSEFVEEGYYKLGEDFELHYEVQTLGTIILKQGENQVLSDITGNHTIILEKILTIFYGNCYKISSNLNGENSSMVKYFLKFNKTISFMEIPTVNIYLTSEENFFGIIGTIWLYGDELKFQLNQKSNDTGSLTFFKLNAKKSKYLNKKAIPCNDQANKCFTEQLLKIKCRRKCVPSTLPLINSIEEWKDIPECHSWDEFMCMAKGIILLSYVESQPQKALCPRYCNQLEYTGNVQADLNAYELSGLVGWSYSISSTTNVNEEYLVYDLPSLVGSVGGTIGIFVGFSVFDLIVTIIDNIQAKFIYFI